METMGSYLFQMACWLTGFWLVYATILRKETFFELNRWFLLAGLVASLTLPLFPIRYDVMTVPKDFSKLTLLGIPYSETENGISKLDYWMIAYASGALIFILRFVWQSAKLYRLRRQCERVTMGKTHIFKLEKDTAPFSFFNSIFISKKLCGETELKTVIAHEKVHIDERHWADLLLLEVARTLQWFNPLLLIYRKAIMQNHEFLADSGTLQKGVSARTYKAILANQMLGVPVLQVANGFTLFNPTKRILMMNKDKTTPAKRLKLLWALPVIALLLAAFSKPNYVSVEKPNITIAANEKTINVTGKVTDEKGKPLQGTSIIVANTTTGTVSDANGNYTLAGINPADEIVFSYVGYETKIAKAASKLNVSMLKKVVVIGYTNEQMAPPPPPPPPPSFELNGTDGKKPLIIIDGKISIIDINTIDPNAIERVEVLKDQSATAVYGDKGKDGVVLITTKKEMAPPPPPPLFDLKSENGKSPLIVVNGKISNIDVKQIDPNTIENINVLKDDNATEKYGSKAKDGAIEITMKKNLNKTDEPVFVVVEDMPQYPGGQAALNSYISKNTIGSTEKGSVVVKFIVGREGNVKDVKVIKSKSDNLDKKALEIINGMPTWKPGMQRNKLVEVEMSIEILFQ